MSRFKENESQKSVKHRAKVIKKKKKSLTLTQAPQLLRICPKKTIPEKEFCEDASGNAI